MVLAKVDPSADVAFQDFDTGSRAINGEPATGEEADIDTTESTDDNTTIKPETKMVKRDVPNALITRENVYRLLEGRLNA